jgi:outer membrane lipoprotein-sorting protein
MNFEAADYQIDKLSYDGSKVKASFVRPGQRSLLGNFILSSEALLKESLLGGTLSTSWALLDMANKKAELSFDGTKKIDGKETYVLEYSPKSADVTVKMYFDKETFRHVRTEYKRTFSAGIGRTANDSAKYDEGRLTVTEDFSDFKKEKELTLPHGYRLNYTTIGQNGTSEVEWTFNLTEFAFNQKLDDKTFDAEAK